MSVVAYALAHVDISVSPPVIKSVETYSSQHISIMLRTTRTFVAIEGYGNSYEEGLAHIGEAMSSPYYSWVIPLMSQENYERCIKLYNKYWSPNATG